METGPIYKEIIMRLRNAWLDGEVASPQEEESLLESLLVEIPDHSK